ncbi:MAG: multiheme c-type cytochrome, partial [Acidobacteriota bacterium]
MRHAAVACLVIALVVAVVVGLPYGIRSAYTSAAQRAAAPAADGLLRGARAFPVVQGRAEGCLVCHAAMTGFAPAHTPAAIGCASCHAGNVATIDKALAHRGMVLIPGNLSDVQQSCGATQCHPTQIDRVNRSIMTSMAGVITVDRTVFGERDTSRAPPLVATLGHTPADSHLRQLCASCHLGAPKTTFGPVRENSRGGGCNACHLNYSAGALRALRTYEQTSGRATRDVPSEHPALSVNIGNEHCFGCHSRSGRISTNYEGWMERAAQATAPIAAEVTRTLEDGRVFAKAEPDVHFTQQLACVDCHTSREVMGDGVTHARKSEQGEVACTDCHV